MGRSGILCGNANHKAQGSRFVSLGAHGSEWPCAGPCDARGIGFDNQALVEGLVSELRTQRRRRCFDERQARYAPNYYSGWLVQGVLDDSKSLALPPWK